MIRKIAYWSSTAIVAVMLLFALSYLTGNEQVVSGFAKAGYPQHLRMAFISAYAAGDGVQVWSLPLALLVLLIVSYVTRPVSRRLMPLPAAA